jgi:hypothetical protein
MARRDTGLRVVEVSSGAQGQFDHLGGSPVVTDRYCCPWLSLSSNQRQGDWSKCGRYAGRCDPPELAPVAVDHLTRMRWSREPQASEQAIRSAFVVETCDGFLTEVAALLEIDGPFHDAALCGHH